MRTRIAVLVLSIAWLLPLAPVRTEAPRFYSDDPISREPETQDAKGAEPADIGLFFELSYNLFVTSHYIPSGTRARNINTIGEVPDSSWFTNRIGARAISDAELARGAAERPAPLPERWVILKEKSAGANPGFTARDANGETWFLAFDAPERPEGASAAVVIASRLFWALGYNQVPMFITSFDPGRATIDPTATKRRPSGQGTRFTRADLDEVLEHVARRADGTYRVAAGRLLPGKALGGFRYVGTRPDDPNDIVPHEHRRELRALRVFGAWTNLTDLKAGNTLDMLVNENGRSIVRHILQDVGSTFGMANREHEWDIGWEHFYDQAASRRRLLSFGFDLSPWQTVPYTEFPSIGRFEGDEFDPRTWRPQTPTTAYMELREDDAFWAARRVMAFTDDLIRAAVHTGQFSNSAAERHLGAVLIKRRDAIGRTYLTAINPVVDPRLDSAGLLTFGNAAVDAGFAEAPTAYHASWFRFDNATSATRLLARTDSGTPAMRAPAALMPTAPGDFIEIDITADSVSQTSWQHPVRAFFRRTTDGWTLVGLERMQERPAGSADPPPVSTKR